MRKFLYAVVIAPALLLASCTTLEQAVALISANAKIICGVVVNASDLVVALQGENVDAIFAGANEIVKSICDQFKAQVQKENNVPIESLPLAKPKQASYVVVVNSKDVKVTPAK